MIIIVSTSTKQQEEYWQQKLQSLPHAKAVAVHEDWKDGAGNGLGTLYAYKKACAKAAQLYQLNLKKMQSEGAPVALFHTAGTGMRLAPLIFSEFNNKSALKLPAKSLLEAVITSNQTLPPGRLSVFWGDQIFIPQDPPPLKPRSHIEMLSIGKQMPSQDEWESHSFHQYGWVFKNRQGEAKIIDKCGYQFFHETICRENADPEKGIGISLGCFSLSYEMTDALLDFFDTELFAKDSKMDTDPHFWMPMVLTKESYLECMKKKNIPPDQAAQHFERMNQFKIKFCKNHPHLIFFDFRNIGPESYWWDYGTIRNYYQNMMKLTGNSRESEAMRAFYQTRLNKDCSCLINCSVKEGSIKNSVLIGVKADYLDVEDCLIVDSKFHRLVSNGSIFYKVNEQNLLKTEPGTVRADLSLNNKYHKIYSTIWRDGKEDWDKILPPNEMSYRDFYNLLAISLN